MKKILKMFGIREIFALTILVITTILVSIFSSAALFYSKVEKVGIASLIAKDITQVLSSSETSFTLSSDKSYGTITVAQGESKFFDITIKNDKNVTTKYKMYYKFTSGITILDVEVGMSDKTTNPETSTLSSGASKIVRVGIKNNSNQSATIDIGVQAGYQNNAVTLISGRKEMPTIIEYLPPNEPKLASGMIPVEYDETKESWVKANTNSKWYDYDNQKWANAVTVTSTNRATYMNASAGTTIPMSAINTMWVWIPRYKYKIPSNIGSSSNITSPPQIDIVFESGTNTTGVLEATYRAGITSSGTNTNYYTHPAFRDGSTVYNSTAYDIGGWDKELTGIWVAKFETGTDNTTCNTTSNETNCKNVNPIIKPDVISLRYQSVSTQFLTSLKLAGGTMNSNTGTVTFSGNTTYGLASSTDTHMMKNTEGGAVALLSQSEYGKMGNGDYTGANKEIYINNSSSYYTGRSGGAPGGSTSINGTYTDQTSTTEHNSYGYYTYDDYLLNYNTNTKGNKIKGKGTGASTTGTIYGIYDMSGGAFENSMGNWNGYSGNSASYNSGFNGLLANGTTKTDGINFPESKYYDKYTKGTNNSTTTKEKAILGDTIWETMKWYMDNNSFPSASFPFASRNGYYGHATNSGVFYFYASNGRADSIYSFRISLIP